ncbi:MAG TPA: ABC transporter substrate-binding protein [Candidatus Faecivivens stercoravium]|uniref:ABC transporter substrate-binding protein n=1 Tax=Candidatus Faecivivens stercoravium TaxID=2840803 RepID=A0A9D1DYV2_9FIRM|nr:ABC transporter substrate-binding protein [Candidatus Faecivivens stercoravium]
MKKRVFAALLAAMSTAALFSACNSGDSGSSSSESSASESSVSTSSAESSASESAETSEETDWAAQAIADRTETEHLVVNWFAWAGSPEGMDRVVAEMNALTVPELNIEVEMQVTDFAQRSQSLTLAFAGGEQIDLYFSTGLGLTQSVQNGYALDLEDDDGHGGSLIETYGQDIIETMGWDNINTSRVGGVLYGTPNERDLAQGRNSIMVRKDILKEAEAYMDLTPDYDQIIWKVESLDDIVTILKAMHDAAPDITTYQPSTMNATGWTNVDNLGGDSFGVLEDWGQSTTVVNFFETDVYKEYVQTMYDLNQYGCISPNALTDTTADSSNMMAGALAAFFTSGKPDIAVGKVGDYEVMAIQGGPDFTSSSQIGGMCWMMGYTTVDPVAAMQYLNFMYASPEWNNLFMWGVEGTDYTLDSDGLAVVDENGTFNHGMQWLAPSQFKGYVKEGNPVDLWEQYEVFNEGSTKSLASGFTFDTAPVSTEYTAVTNVYNQYQKSIEFGFSDPESSIDEMNAAMKTAGLDKIIAEKQSQLDAWLALQD